VALRDASGIREPVRDRYLAVDVGRQRDVIEHPVVDEVDLDAALDAGVRG
jgi:hypothetical protein